MFCTMKACPNQRNHEHPRLFWGRSSDSHDNIHEISTWKYHVVSFSGFGFVSLDVSDICQTELSREAHKKINGNLRVCHVVESTKYKLGESNIQCKICSRYQAIGTQQSHPICIQSVLNVVRNLLLS